MHDIRMDVTSGNFPFLSRGTLQVWDLCRVRNPAEQQNPEAWPTILGWWEKEETQSMSRV